MTTPQEPCDIVPECLEESGTYVGGSLKQIWRFFQTLCASRPSCNLGPVLGLPGWSVALHGLAMSVTSHLPVCRWLVPSPSHREQKQWAADRLAVSVPFQVFQFASQPGPMPVFLLRQVNPWDLTSAPLSLSRASCQGDDKIGFWVKGTNLSF